MARADLLVSLVKASAAGDQEGVRSVTEAIIADERAKNHHVLADRLLRAASNGARQTKAAYMGRENSLWRRFATELVPHRHLEDLVLSAGNAQACRDLIEEQHRASVLRAHSLEPRHRVLLIGPPGNGKTALAEAIAESLSVSFIVVRYEAMIGSYLG